jgi:acyl carrier protein
MKSLKDAVTELIAKNYGKGGTFSAYDITRLLRKDVNDDIYRVQEFVDTTHKLCPYKQDIPHSKVREVVVELFNDEVLIRKSDPSYIYYLYEVAPVTTATVPDGAMRMIEALKKFAEDAGCGKHDKIEMNDILIEDLGLDSLDIVEFAIYLEEETFKGDLNGVEIDIGDNVLTVEDLWNCVTKALNRTSKNATLQKPTNVATPPPIQPSRVEQDVKGYLIRKFSKKESPTLKMVQSAAKSGLSVAKIGEIVKKLGFNIEEDKFSPYNQWVVRYDPKKV